MLIFQIRKSFALISQSGDEISAEDISKNDSVEIIAKINEKKIEEKEEDIPLADILASSRTCIIYSFVKQGKTILFI